MKFPPFGESFAVYTPKRNLIGAFDLDLRSPEGLMERRRLRSTQFGKSFAAGIERLE
jgi:hypothetical protein